MINLEAIHPPAPGSCSIRLVDLIGAWVAANMPEKDPFSFTDVNGKSCLGTFDVDVIPAFTQANLWYAGANSCRVCHGPDVQVSYARLDLSSYQGILAGSGRSSADSSGDDILAGGNWQASALFDVLSKGEMPPDQPAGFNPGGPLVAVGNTQ